jgi:hypothetical protein
MGLAMSTAFLFSAERSEWSDKPPSAESYLSIPRLPNPASIIYVEGPLSRRS